MPIETSGLYEFCTAGWRTRHDDSCAWSRLPALAHERAGTAPFARAARIYNLSEPDLEKPPERLAVPMGQPPCGGRRLGLPVGAGHRLTAADRPAGVGRG
jgi:hypothetical protein